MLARLLAVLLFTTPLAAAVTPAAEIQTLRELYEATDGGNASGQLDIEILSLADFFDDDFSKRVVHRLDVESE